MRFKNFLNKIEEDPVTMWVDDDPQDMDTAKSYAFGGLAGNIYVAGFFGNTIKDLKITENGVPLAEVIDPLVAELEPLLVPYVSEEDHLIDRFLRKITLMGISKVANRFEPYHDFIAQVANSILLCKKLLVKLKENPNMEKKDFLATVKAILKENKKLMNTNLRVVGRNGLNPAGRIFADIKGISFYGPKPSKTDVVKMLNAAGISDVEDYTIEYEEEEDKHVQVTMSDYNMKTDSKSSDKTEKDIAAVAKAKARKPISKQLRPGETVAQARARLTTSESVSKKQSS